MNRPDFEQGRRDFLSKAANLGKGVIAGVGVKVLIPETAHAAGWQPKWDYSIVGLPKGNEGDILPLGLSTDSRSIVAMTTGDFTYTDSAGRSIQYAGKGDPNVDRISLILVDGPVSKANGGAEVTPFVRALHNWIGVTLKPDGGMTAETWQQLIDERVASIRDSQSANGRGGNAFTGFIDVARINGKTGRILDTRVIYPV